MRDEYDFSNTRKNTHAKQVKKLVTIQMDAETLDYFKVLAEETGIPYQSLINLYLKDCIKKKRRPNFSWQQ